MACSAASAFDYTRRLVAFIDIMQGLRYLFEPQGERGGGENRRQ